MVRARSRVAPVDVAPVVAVAPAGVDADAELWCPAGGTGPDPAPPQAASSPLRPTVATPRRMVGRLNG
jgi:hypothetical protein